MTLVFKVEEISTSTAGVNLILHVQVSGPLHMLFPVSGTPSPPLPSMLVEALCILPNTPLFC